MHNSSINWKFVIIFVMFLNVLNWAPAGVRLPEGGGQGQQAAEGGAGRLGGHQGQHRGPGDHVQTTGKEAERNEHSKTCVILS